MCFIKHFLNTCRTTETYEAQITWVTPSVRQSEFKLSRFQNRSLMVRHWAPSCRPSAYDPGIMGANNILERVASLKEEMEDLRAANARLDEPRWKKGSYESRLSRLEEIKTELAEIIGQFKRTGTD
jgi:hypothetical protein